MAGSLGPFDRRLVHGRGGIEVSGRDERPRELDARMGGEPWRVRRLGGGDRLPGELLGVARLVGDERARAETGEGEGGVGGEF